MPKYLRRTSGSMKDVLSSAVLGSMSSGQEMNSAAQPTTGGHSGLAPSPPNAIFPIRIQMADPNMTSHHGAADGSMKENSRPIRAASKLSTRSGRPVRRVPSASAATAVETERAMTLRAGIPQFMPAMTTAGRRARRKVMLLFQMVRPQCQNGGALTARSVCCMIFAPVWK